MKALRWYARKDVRYVDAPEPSPGPGQLKVKVSLAGICGTDLKEYAYGPVMIPPDQVPLTMGHEFAGTVMEVGKGVKGFKAGDRVSGVGYYYCGECYVCKKGLYNLCVNQGFTGLFCDGCMAEYFVIPDYACYKLPDSVPDELGALVEPLAVALYSVARAKPQPEDCVVVIGAGMIGLCVIQALKATGISQVMVSARRPERLKLAKGCGANVVIDADKEDIVSEVKNTRPERMADVVFECAGSATAFRQSIG